MQDRIALDTRENKQKREIMSYSKKETEYWIAKNMMFISNKSAKINDTDVDRFTKKYHDIIESVSGSMPRGMTTVAAAVGKCAVKYGPERALKFLKNFKDGVFEGKDDPVYHFWMWIHGLKGPKRKKHDISTYEITLYACKQYCMGKKIKRLERSKDIFDWTNDWKENQKKKNSSSSLISSS